MKRALFFIYMLWVIVMVAIFFLPALALFVAEKVVKMMKFILRTAFNALTFEVGK